MRIAVYAAMGLVALLLQAAVVPHALVFGQGPALPILPVVAVGLLYGTSEGAWAGGVIGALTDLFLGGAWGVGTLLYMATGYACGRLAGARGGGRLLVAVAAAGVAAAVVRAAGIAALRAGGGHVSLSALVPSPAYVAYTAVLAPFVLALFDGRATGRRRRRERAARL
ncbi:MAG: rod shape-determining protein MreD [Firmicutes bacterium]|nr:rod shape-determining protein MreD [Bacillota bacterium]